MAYYKTGTVSLNNGSDIVTAEGGANWTAAQVRVGDGFLGPNNTIHEIVEVVSPTQLRLARPYVGASGSGQSYAIQPSQAPIRDLYSAVNSLVVEYRGIADGPGQGLFFDGSATAPGLRFANDQDTGFARSASNQIGVVTGGKVRATIDDTVLRYSGVRADIGPAVSTPGSGGHFRLHNDAGQQQWLLGHLGNVGATALSIYNIVTGNEAARIDTAGNFLIGVGSGNEHRIRKGAANNAGNAILNVMADAFTATFTAVSGGQGSSANAAMRLATDANTGRSLNAGGTINASGADYAEYVRKADGCGTIAKGDVCGIDRDGKLTKTWADAVSYVVKSTDPNLVGGDSWGTDVGSRPEAPAPLAPQPTEPSAPEPFAEATPEQAEGESEGEFAIRVYQWEEARDAATLEFERYAAAMDAYPAALAEWMAAEREHVAATADHEAALAEWEAEFEAERQMVDRIAFCGIVPVNVSDEVLAECDAALADGERVYLVASANGGGIAAKAVRKSAMTLADHLDRLGPVWRIEDGRPVIDVQHG